MNQLAAFAHEKYLSLETFRKDGTGVKTPIWFAEDEGKFYGYTMADAYKVKRIRNNSKVRVAPCDMRGNVQGEWVEGRACILDIDADAAEYAASQQLLTAKYGLIKRVLDLLAKLRQHRRAGIVITFD